MSMTADAHSFTGGFSAATNIELTIAQVADLYGLTHRTLRFYEEIGLIPVRRVGLARYFGAEALRRLDLVQVFKRMGLSLNEAADAVRQLESKPHDAVRADLDRMRAEALGRLAAQRAAIAADEDFVRNLDLVELAEKTLRR